jgi:hypothetical protein
VSTTRLPIVSFLADCQTAPQGRKGLRSQTKRVAIEFLPHEMKRPAIKGPSSATRTYEPVR